MILQEREIFQNIYNGSLDNIELVQKINFDNLKHFTEESGMKTDFSAKDYPITFLNNIKRNKQYEKEIRLTNKKSFVKH